MCRGAQAQDTCCEGQDKGRIVGGRTDLASHLAGDTTDITADGV